jgi:hypothetical protein
MKNSNINGGSVQASATDSKIKSYIETEGNIKDGLKCENIITIWDD